MRIARRLSARIDSWPALPLQIGVVAFLVAVLLPMAIARGIDGDEGYYTLAAVLVADGRLPYEDFFYPQMPLLPFAYGPWMAIFGESWFAARSLSVVSGVLTGLLLFRHVAQRWRSQALGVLAALLFGSTVLVLLWLPIVKTYPLSTFLLFAAFVVADRPDLPQTPARWIAAGVLLGLGLDARLLFAAAVPVFLAYALWSAPGADGRRNGIAHAAGIGIGLLPTFLFFALDPRRFYFHNLGYHSVRSPGGLFGAFDSKLDMVWQLLSDYPQFTILVLLAVLSLAVAWRLERRIPLTYAIAAALAAASIAPNPPFDQDYVTLVPFLVAGALELVARLPALTGRIRSSHGLWLRRGLAAALALYLIIPLIEVPRMTQGGYLGGGDFFADSLRPSTVRAVTRAIDDHTRPGEVIMAFWPGWLLGSHAEQFPGFENDFGPQGVLNAGYSDERAWSYKLASPERLDDAIRRREVGLVVTGALGDWTKRHESVPLILRSGYRPVDAVGVTRLLARGRPGPAVAIESCVRRAGQPTVLGAPTRDVTSVAVGPASGRARLFVYPSRARASEAVPAVARLLRLEPSSVRRIGATVVAYPSEPSPRLLRAIERCASLQAGRG
jgi:hypothetical protein